MEKNARDVCLIKIENEIAIRVLRIIVLQMETHKSKICKFCCVNILNWKERTHKESRQIKGKNYHLFILHSHVNVKEKPFRKGSRYRY